MVVSYADSLTEGSGNSKYVRKRYEVSDCLSLTSNSGRMSLFMRKHVLSDQQSEQAVMTMGSAVLPVVLDPREKRSASPPVS